MVYLKYHYYKSILSIIIINILVGTKKPFNIITVKFKFQGYI